MSNLKDISVNDDDNDDDNSKHYNFKIMKRGRKVARTGLSLQHHRQQWCCCKLNKTLWMTTSSKKRAPTHLMCSDIDDKAINQLNNVPKDLQSAKHQHVNVQSLNSIEDCSWRNQNAQWSSIKWTYALHFMYFYYFNLSGSFFCLRFFCMWTGHIFLKIYICWFNRCDHRAFTAAQLENITRTLAQMLEGYDIRLRPNFGGKC